MSIQWFPGHMAKARREASEKLKLVDVVLELLDARLPLSSRNPLIDELIQQKKRVIVFNKCDLADDQQTAAWRSYFQSQGHTVVTISAKDGKGIKQLEHAVAALMEDKMAQLRSKGVRARATRVMILGIPNVGKSTLINRLLQKNKAVTGNKPGVTKGQQWLKVGERLELLDTPGILWPKFDDPEVGLKLALTGAIKDTLLHWDDVALFALDYWGQRYRLSLQRVYGMNDTVLSLPLSEQLIWLTKQLGFQDDYDRASERLIMDIRGGKLGTYTLDEASVPLG